MFFLAVSASPEKRRSAGKVRTQLSRMDPAYTLIVDNYDEEKSSQELFQFSLVQATLE